MGKKLKGKTFLRLILSLSIPGLSFGASSQPAEEVWQALHKLPKELQALLGTSRVQLNTVEDAHKYYQDSLQILAEVVLKPKR